MRKLPLLLVSVALATACGGSKAAAPFKGFTGASVAPASALAFVGVDTDARSAQWKNADALLKKFPFRDKLLAQINAGLSSSNVDFGRDIKPLLGPEVDLVVVSASSPQLVGMTQPTDAKKFVGHLDAAKPPSPHMELDGWTIFARSQAALDAFKTEQAKGRLADVASYKDATVNLPSDANGIAYVNGSQAVGLLKQTVPSLGALPSAQFEWLGAALSTQPNSAKLDGAVKTGQNVGPNFTSTLLSQVPSFALVVASFHGSAQLTQQLTQNPTLAQAVPQLRKLLGVGLPELAGLVEGEGALYVAAGVPYPEVTLVLKEQDPAAALRTLDKVAAQVAATFKAKLTQIDPGIKKLRFKKIAFYYGVFNGNLVISDAEGHLLTGVGTAITDDPIFTAAAKAASLPDSSAGFVYVNLRDTVPLIESYANATNVSISPAVVRDLAPLQSFIAYATGNGGIVKFSALLQAR